MAMLSTPRILRREAARLRPLVVSAIALFALASDIEAQQRAVIVNGELLDDEGLTLIDQLNCGQPVGDGIYALDLGSRTWGYADSEERQALPDCEAVAPVGEDEVVEAPGSEEPATADDCESRYEYFEDRMMYCYGVSPP
ncbi:MAG: hypothetical protein HONDAALG_00576 [Gammaproteobacteria bacterium]|nr:hypothetical protein [Gammaproteobacteria bacterium]